MLVCAGKTLAGVPAQPAAPGAPSLRRLAGGCSTGGEASLLAAATKARSATALLARGVCLERPSADAAVPASASPAAGRFSGTALNTLRFALPLLPRVGPADTSWAPNLPPLARFDLGLVLAICATSGASAAGGAGVEGGKQRRMSTSSAPRSGTVRASGRSGSQAKGRLALVEDASEERDGQKHTLCGLIANLQSTNRHLRELMG